MFHRTHQALTRDRDGRSPVVIGAVCLLMAAWLTWFFGVELTLYEVSNRARVEVSSLVHPIDVPVSARIISLKLELGRAVKAGDVIAELDSDAQKLALAQSEARLQAIALEVEALSAEREVQLAAIALERQHGRHALTEASLKRAVSALKAQQAKLDDARTSKLAASGFVSAAEAQRTASEARGLVAVDQAARTEALLVRTAAQRSEVALRARAAELDRLLSVRRGDAMVETAQSELLRHEIEQRIIRATAPGRISEIAPVHVGAYVPAGTRLATVLAPDDLRLVADFEPSTALGRIGTGQVARVHFIGFPAVEYGSMRTTVRTVATELRDGLVRVELDVDPTQVRVPLQHGLPASVSVELERVTAAQLALRAVGVVVAPKSAGTP